MGFDIYACFDEDYIKLSYYETKLIPTGIASSCDPEYGFVLRERGSTGSKGMALRAGVIDSGYRNEWFVGITNTTDKEIFISKIDAKEIIQREYPEGWHVRTADGDYELSAGDLEKVIMVYPYSKAIAQALVVPVPKVEVEEISYEELKEIKSERGMGALGSSNK
jgi:dUTP pyrophosphatase